MHRYGVAKAGAEQGAGDRRVQAYFAAGEVGFVGADQGYRAFYISIVYIGDGGTEEDLVAVGLASRVYDLGYFEAFAEEAGAFVDFAQAFFAVEVVAIFRAVAVAGGPVDNFDDFGAFDAHQFVQLGAHAGGAGGGHVGASAGGEGGFFVFGHSKI